MPPSKSCSANTSSWSLFTIAFSTLIPLMGILLVYQLDSFDPAPMPIHVLAQAPLEASKSNGNILKGDVEFLGKGQLQGPEDIAYDGKTGFIYTTCEDGWIKRVRLNDSVVENWVNTGGRPLGIVLGNNNVFIVADAYKGLLKVNEEGKIELLTNEAQGLKFKYTNGVDIGEDGIIYFSDASYKYDVHETVWDIMEGRPHGRLLCFDPSTNNTTVLLSELYFSNGVALSPNQNFLIFCETPLRRCRKYYIKGNKKGQIEEFVNNLPGLPDNIHYDGNGHFWIGLSSEKSRYMDIAFKYPKLRKLAGIVMKWIGPIHMASNAGVFVVDLEGNPIAHYSDPGLKFISSAVMIQNHLYLGLIFSPYILRLNLDLSQSR
ncbi:strictosidine synthase-like 4 [Euphorbia peplus]|nr:strictosidine synthase-like 4 [Euphorbia peplus]